MTPSADDPLHVDLRLGIEPRGLMLGKHYQHVLKVKQLVLLLFRSRPTLGREATSRLPSCMVLFYLQRLKARSLLDLSIWRMAV